MSDEGLYKPAATVGIYVTTDSTFDHNDNQLCNNEMDGTLSRKYTMGTCTVQIVVSCRDKENDGKRKMNELLTKMMAIDAIMKRM